MHMIHFSISHHQAVCKKGKKKKKTLQQQLIVTQGYDLSLFEILILSNTTTYKHKAFIHSMQIKMMALNCSCTSYIRNYLVLLM